MNANATFNPNSFFNSQIQPEFLTANDIAARYRVSKMTLWRWIKSEEVNFPKPIYINKRRYFRIADIAKWESERGNGSVN